MHVQEYNDVKAKNRLNETWNHVNKPEVRRNGKNGLKTIFVR